jgi:cyclopropane-fatty-acyl-phospholipid synthase
MRALLADRLFKKADSITHGHVELTTPDGRTRHFGGRSAGPAAHLEIRDWRVVANLATRGDVGFLEDYKAGLWAGPWKN